MRIHGSQRFRYSEHLRAVDALLDPIRNDRSIDDAERRRLIDEVLAAANARALSLRADRRAPVEEADGVVEAPIAAHDLEARRRQRGLARVG